MQEAGKQRCNMVPQSLNSNGEGCRSPVQWPSCFIAMFWLFEFAKISMQNVRKAKANFASNRRSSKQSKFKCLYCISILLLCRAPIEDPEFSSISIPKLPPPIVSVPWGCRSDCLWRRIFFLIYASCVSRNYLLLGEGLYSSLLCFLLLLVFSLNRFPKKATPNKGPKRVLLFASIVFTSKMEKHLTFSRKFLLHKKGSSYSPTVLCLTRIWYMGYIQSFLQWIRWGQNHFH